MLISIHVYGGINASLWLDFLYKGGSLPHFERLHNLEQIFPPLSRILSLSLSLLILCLKVRILYTFALRPLTKHLHLGAKVL